MPDRSVQEVTPRPRPGSLPADAGGAAELERVRARDPEALAAFFERHFDRVYGLVYRLLGDRALAEDMTQEVFLKVHRAAHTIDPARDPVPWLVTIAHNACRDLWRSNAWKLTRRATSLDGDSPLAETLSRGTNDPERDALQNERERPVRRAAPAARAAAGRVVMHDYRDRARQIAAITGVNYAAARATAGAGGTRRPAQGSLREPPDSTSPRTRRGRAMRWRTPVPAAGRFRAPSSRTVAGRIGESRALAPPCAPGSMVSADGLRPPSSRSRSLRLPRWR
jgi:RNA polymerase sigma-70 factor (ECF subfamily)